MMACLNDEAGALRYMECKLWPDGPLCPRCEVRGPVDKVDGAARRNGVHKCYTCRRSFSITDGTIFEGSNVPLHKWLWAVYLTEGGTKPIRPHHLAHILDVSFETAKNMSQKLGNNDARLTTTMRTLATDLCRSAAAFA